MEIKPPDFEIECMLKEMKVDEAKMQEYMKRFLREVERGLGKDSHPSSVVKCFITYVTDLPTGTERGKFLALDLGGTNFRVIVIALSDRQFDMEAKIYAIPQEIMTSNCKTLFGHIANCLSEFLKEFQLCDISLPLGFTFSFPLKQTGLTSGEIERWTKGFNIEDGIGKDAAKLLSDALKDKGVSNIEVVAVLNDTTGTLMSCAWKNKNTKIGLIVGTGSNACYVEKVSNAPNYNGDPAKKNVVINTEMGAFGDDGKLDIFTTEFDRDVDANSINPGRQLHEKMISGMYMGELVRLICVKLINRGLLLNGKIPPKMANQGGFPTEYVSEIELDSKPDRNEYSGSNSNTRNVLQRLGANNITDRDCNIVLYVCQLVSSRAAYLVAAGMATLINKMDSSPITVAIDGSVYRNQPLFHDYMIEMMKKLVKPEIQFDLMLSEDGSGRGAALVAAVAAAAKGKTCT